MGANPSSMSPRILPLSAASISKDYFPGSMFHYLGAVSGKDKGGLNVYRAMTSKALGKDTS